MLKAKDFKEFNGDTPEFIKLINTQTIYMRKPKGKSYISFWLEKDDEWFVNIQKNGDKTSCWITRPELDDWLTYMRSQSYMFMVKNIN